MNKIKVVLKGETPLLMNSPHAMLLQDGGVTIKTKKYDWNEEAEKVAYRDDKGFLYVPREAIKGSMLNASSYKKVGRIALRPLIAGGLRIPDEKIQILRDGKPIKDYEIDLRTVVIQKKDRVIKSRPKIQQWELNFEIWYNPDLLPEPDNIFQVLKEAGERIGLLDFRPQKTGEFGCFSVVEFKPIK